MNLNRLAMGSRVSHMRVLPALLLLATVGTALLCLGTKAKLTADYGITNALRPAVGVRSQPTEPLRILSTELPLIFEANYGQADSRVKFLSRGWRYGLFLTSDQAVLEMQTSTSRPHSSNQSSVIRMRLVRANPASQISGAEPLSGHSNYFIGNDPAQWHRNIPQFARVRYRSVYSGIDLVYYGKQGQLEYDFEVAPQADPRQIALSFAGAKGMKLTPNGDVLLETGEGSVRLQAPRIYQKHGQDQQQVPGRFVMRTKNQVGFEIGSYDRTRQLIIDPVLSYSTYLGGSGSEGCFAIIGSAIAGCPAIAADPGGAALYVAFPTTSTGFQTTPHAIQPNLFSGATANIVVAELDPSAPPASQLVFSTYLGGNGTDYPVGIAVDSGFNVYVAGTTTSGNFPTNGTITPFRATPRAAGTHVFVSQLNASGSTLLYSTYLSGSATDIATGLAIDNKGSAFVTGITTSTDFPVSTTILPYQATPIPGSSNRFFASKISTLSSNAGLSGLLYSTYFGGNNPADGAVQGGGIAVDTNGNFYITGTTNFLHLGNPNTDFPIVNAFQSCLDTPPTTPPATSCTAPAATPPPTDAFVAKFNPNVNSSGSLLYSTYLGGIGNDSGFAIAVDSGFNAYVTGLTTSGDWTIPTSIVPFQKCLDAPTISGSTACTITTVGPPDAFIAKIGGSEISTTNTVFPLNYFSYLGGGQGGANDVGLGIAVDSIQHVRVTGYTNSTDFPTNTTPPPPTPPTPIQPNLKGAFNAFVANIDTTTTAASAVGQWATYLGGSGTDHGTSIAMDVNGAIYLAGDTSSSDFPTLNAFQTLTGNHVFASKISGQSVLSIPPVFPASSTTANPVVSPNPAAVGNQVTFTYTIVNTGFDPASNVIMTDSLASNATFNSATASPGSCIPTPVSNVETCAMGTLPVTPAGATTASTIKINITPTAPGSLGDKITVSSPNSPSATSTAVPVQVTDFQIVAAPTSATVTAGQAASYTITGTPLPTYNGQVSLTCSSALPAGATCAFSTTPLNFSSGSSATSTLTINTTARPVVTASLHPAPTTLAFWLPLSGLAFLGLGLGARHPRRRLLLSGFLLLSVVGVLLLYPSCGYNKPTKTPATGTPAGTYAITVSGTSGSASHTSTVTLIVQ